MASHQAAAVSSPDPGLLTALVADGRPLLVLVALSLMLSGLFALFLAVTGSFLPHDVAFHSASHLAPAWAGAAVYTLGIFASVPPPHPLSNEELPHLHPPQDTLFPHSGHPYYLKPWQNRVLSARL